MNACHRWLVGPLVLRPFGPTLRRAALPDPHRKRRTRLGRDRQQRTIQLEWSKTFTDARLAAAIVDRVTFHAHIIQTGTTSYRLNNR